MTFSKKIIEFPVISERIVAIQLLWKCVNNILYATFDIYKTLNVHTITAICLSGIGYIIIRIDSSFRKIVWREFEFCALHIMCFLYIKNGWNFLLLYNIDEAIPFM